MMEGLFSCQVLMEESWYQGAFLALGNGCFFTEAAGLSAFVRSS